MNVVLREKSGQNDYDEGGNSNDDDEDEDEDV